MIEIHPASMLALMFLLHLVADYTLQGCLANLKQKSWWSDQIPKNIDERKRLLTWRMYKNDYMAGLACHAMYWSLVVCLPLLMIGGPAYAISSVIQGAIHYFVDDMKANKKAINLIEDQIIHAGQIFGVWGVWMALK